MYIWAPYSASVALELIMKYHLKQIWHSGIHMQKNRPIAIVLLVYNNSILVITVWKLRLPVCVFFVCFCSCVKPLLCLCLPAVVRPLPPVEPVRVSWSKEPPFHSWPGLDPWHTTLQQVCAAHKHTYTHTHTHTHILRAAAAAEF